MKQNIIFLGTTQAYGYNFSAANTKTEFLARGLYEQGCTCTIINSIIGLQLKTNYEILDKKFARIISYKYRVNQFISWILNAPKLYQDLKKLKQRNSKNTIILEFPDYHIFLLYILFSRILRYKIIVISHEWGPTIKSTHILRKPSVWLYSKTFGYFTDGILPISEYIIKKIKHFNKPYIKIPVLAEFNKIPIREDTNNYFLYCVYAAYTRVIIPLIDAFVQFSSSISCNYELILVLAGSDSQVEVIEKYISITKLPKQIKIKRKVPYIELLKLYKNASGLLIPMDPNSEQDYARFSQKIAEYTSSASPIISCKVGEVAHYFKDKESVIFCEYSKKGFVEAFTWVATHPQESQAIGHRGYEIGSSYFDYKKNSKDLVTFLGQKIS